MAENQFNQTVESLFRGMDTFLTTKTVVGEPVKVDESTTILPLVDVSFGVGAGAFAQEKKNNAGGGLGGKMTPSSILVIKDGSVRLVNIKNQDVVTKLLDMIPDLADRFAAGNRGTKDEKVKDAVDQVIYDAETK